MSANLNLRKRAVHIEVGADARSYVSDGQRVTMVPLTIKRRQNRKLLIPPATDHTIANREEAPLALLSVQSPAVSVDETFGRQTAAVAGYDEDEDDY